MVAGSVLLPPELVALMGIVQHVPEWLKLRYPWYIQSFNICNYTLNGLAAWGVAKLVIHFWPFPSTDARWAFSSLAAVVVFVALNHVLLAAILFFARGHRPRATGLFSAESLSTDVVLAALGIGIAAFWTWNPWLVAFGLAPLVLIHRSLHVP